MTELESKIKTAAKLALYIQEIEQKKEAMENNLRQFRQVFSDPRKDKHIRYLGCELYFDKPVMDAHEAYMTNQIKEMEDALVATAKSFEALLKD